MMMMMMTAMMRRKVGVRPLLQWEDSDRYISDRLCCTVRSSADDGMISVEVSIVTLRISAPVELHSDGPATAKLHARTVSDCPRC